MLRVASELKRTKTTRVSVHEEDLGSLAHAHAHAHAHTHTPAHALIVVVRFKSLAHALIHARVAIELKRTTRVSEHEEDLVKPGCAV